MKRRLPPLNTLVAAEAVARWQSIKKAADELCVTPSAISHHIRALEDWFGVRLFDRRTHAIKLTPAGERYFLLSSRILDELSHATLSELGNSKTRTTLHIQTTDSFASCWLAPRLHKFQMENPQISIQVVTFEFTERFRGTEFDLAILYGSDSADNAISRKLLPEIIFPVCAPDFAASKENDAKRMLAHPLIDDFNLGVTWSDWLSEAKDALGSKLPKKITLGTKYNHSHVALRASNLGHGLCLASSPLVLDDLEAGSFVAPFPTYIDTGGGYYLYFRKHAERHKPLKKLIDWLEREAQAYDQQCVLPFLPVRQRAFVEEFCDAQ